MSKYEPVLVKWYDAQSHDDWIDIESAGDELPLIQTLGYLLKETETEIIVAMQLDLKNEQTSMIMTIPNLWVESIERVRVVKPRKKKPPIDKLKKCTKLHS